MINTLEKFLIETGLDRHNNYPSLNTLKGELTSLRIEDEDLTADILAYFLYDGASI